MARLTNMMALFRGDDAKQGSQAMRFDERGPVMVISMIALMLAEFYVQNNKVFSNLVTLGAASQLLGFVFLAFKVWQQGSVSGLSGKAMQLYALSTLCRLFSILQYDGYLPVDWTGDGLYQGIEVCSMIVVYALLVCVRHVYPSTYDAAADTCSVRWFVLGSVLLAAFVHPHLCRRALADACWMCALYLEAVALLPQLCMLRTLRREVRSDRFIGPFVMFVAVARLFMASFWARTCAELKPRGADFNLPGFAVLGSQLLQGVLFADSMI